MSWTPYAYGPIKAKDEKHARQIIREVWHLKTTRGIEVWETK